MVAVDDESVAELLWVEMAVPVTLFWVPGLVTVTVLVMFQVKVVLWASVWVSVAVTVTEQAQAVVGVPLMTPPELMERPAGRPVAPNVTELPPVVSCGALMVRLVMAEPEVLVWVPGLVTDRASTFQVRVIEPAVPPPASVPPPAAAVAVARWRGVGRVDIGGAATTATTGIATTRAPVATATATAGVAASATATAGSGLIGEPASTVSAAAAARAGRCVAPVDPLCSSPLPPPPPPPECRPLRRLRRSRHRWRPLCRCSTSWNHRSGRFRRRRTGRSGAVPAGAAAAAPAGHGDGVAQPLLPRQSPDAPPPPPPEALPSIEALSSAGAPACRPAAYPPPPDAPADGEPLATAGRPATTTASELDRHCAGVVGEREGGGDLSGVSTCSARSRLVFTATATAARYGQRG